MKYGLHDDREDGEHTGVCFAEISKTLAIQAAIFLEQNHLSEFMIHGEL